MQHYYQEKSKEFTLHENMANEIGCGVIFARPYYSLERGQNENAKGLLRQYFLKKMELVDISMKQLVGVVDNLTADP